MRKKSKPAPAKKKSPAKAAPKTTAKPAAKVTVKPKASPKAKPAAKPKASKAPKIKIDPMLEPLKDAEEIACQQFVLNGGDRSKAYRHAFPQSANWKDKTVHEHASRLFKLGKVEARVQELQKLSAEIAEDRFKVNAEYILGRLHSMDTLDIADIMNDDGSAKPLREWPLTWRQSISGIDVSELFEGTGKDRDMIGLLKKIKWPDKVKIIELMGKHVSVNAFREQLGVSDPRGRPLAILTRDMSQEEAALTYKEIIEGRRG